MKNNVNMEIHELEVVPVGKILSLHGWTEEQIKEAIFKDDHQTKFCWNCCYDYDWPTCRIPFKRDDRFSMTLYYAYGMFCTYNCAKSYLLSNLTNTRSNAMDIALMANKVRHLFQGHKSGPENTYFVKPVPNRNLLQKFGGRMTIGQFRDGCMKLNGEIIGQDSTNPMRMCRKFQCQQMKPTAFIDETLVKIVRVTVNSTQALQTVRQGPQSTVDNSKKRNYQNSEQQISQKMQESKQRKIEKQKKNMYTLDHIMKLNVNN